MTFEVYSYWDTQNFYNIFQAVALFLSDAGFYELMMMAVTIGALFALLMAVFGKGGSPLDIAKYVMSGIILFYIIVLPRATVTVIDKSYFSPGTSPPMTIANIPLSLAFLAHTTSAFGQWIDEKMGTYYTLPSDIKGAGTHMTRKILTETILSQPQNAMFLYNMNEYVRECVVYDLNSGVKNLDDIMNSDDTFAALGNTNPAIFVTIAQPAALGTGTDYNTMTCTHAFNTLESDRNDLSLAMESRLAQSMFPNKSSGEAATALAGVLTSSMQQFMHTSTLSAEQLFKNAVAQNTFLKAMGEITGDPISMSKAVLGVDYGSDQKEQLAKSFVYTLTIVQLLAYGFFPVIILLVIVAGPQGFQPLMLFVKVLIWLGLVQGSQIIIDYLIIMNTSGESAASITGFAAGSINSWMAAGGIINGMEDQLQNALFASLALSWALLSGGASIGSSIGTALFSGAQTYNERTATDLAAEGKNEFGSTSYMNTSMNNSRGFDYNMSPNIMNSSIARWENDLQAIRTVSSTGRAGFNSSASGGNSAYWGESQNRELTRSIQEQATSAREAAFTKQVLSEYADMRADSTMFESGVLAEISNKYSSGHDVSHGSRYEQAFKTMDGWAKSIADKTDLTHAEALSAVVNGVAQGTVDSPKGFAGNIAQNVKNMLKNKRNRNNGKDGEPPLYKPEGGAAVGAQLQGSSKNSIDDTVNEVVGQTIDAKQAKDLSETASYIDTESEKLSKSDEWGNKTTGSEKVSDLRSKSETLKESSAASLKESEAWNRVISDGEKVTDTSSIDLQRILGSTIPGAQTMEKIDRMMANGNIKGARALAMHALKDLSTQAKITTPMPLVTDRTRDLYNDATSKVYKKHDENGAAIGKGSTAPGLVKNTMNEVQNAQESLNKQINTWANSTQREVFELSEDVKKQINGNAALREKFEKMEPQQRERVQSQMAQILQEMGPLGVATTGAIAGGLTTFITNSAGSMAATALAGATGAYAAKKSKTPQTSSVPSERKAAQGGGSAMSKRMDSIVGKAIGSPEKFAAKMVGKSLIPGVGWALTAADLAYTISNVQDGLKQAGIITDKMSASQQAQIATGAFVDYAKRKLWGGQNKPENSNEDKPAEKSDEDRFVAEATQGLMDRNPGMTIEQAQAATRAYIANQRTSGQNIEFNNPSINYDEINKFRS